MPVGTPATRHAKGIAPGGAAKSQFLCGRAGHGPERGIRMTDSRIVETIAAGPTPGVPNHPSWPALLLRGVPEAAEGPRAARRLFQANGWGGAWDWTIYDFHHWHPASHEALAVTGGRAELALGGPGGPSVDVAAGDVLILPAGFGHRRMAASGDFAVTGAYPPGQESPEVRRDDPAAARAAAERIAAVPRPDTDPVDGTAGAVLDHWT